MEVRKRADYQYSSAAPKDWTQELPDLSQIEQYEKPAREATSHRRKKTARESSISISFILLSAVALVIMGVVLVQYLSLQSDVSKTLNRIAQKENTLSELRLENDEHLNAIETGVNLEEIRRIAIEDLGMRYAGTDQIMTYSSELRNYVVQYEALP